MGIKGCPNLWTYPSTEPGCPTATSGACDCERLKAEVARLTAERDAAVDEFREARNTSYLERAERAETQLAPLREALEQAAVNLQALGTIRESTITPTDFRTIATNYANRARLALSGVQETQTKTTKHDDPLR